MTRRLRCQFVDQGSPDSHRFLSLLEGAGYEVLRSFSAESALADFPRLQPDIVLLIEPEESDSTVGAVRGVRSTPFGKQTPILLLGACARRRGGRRDRDWQEAGCDAVLDLPCSDRQFVQAVEAVLRERGVPSSRLFHQSDLADMDEELAKAMQSLDEEESRPAPLLEPGTSAPLRQAAPVEPAGSFQHDEPGWSQIPRVPPPGPLEGPLERPSRGAPSMMRPPPPDQALGLRTVVTLGAGALIAGASVAFLVWLLVYTGFEGSEERPVVPRVEEPSTHPPKRQQDDDEDPRGGDPGGEPGEAEEEPGGNPLLLNPYSAAPTLLLPLSPPGARREQGSSGGEDEGGGEEPGEEGDQSPEGTAEND